MDDEQVLGRIEELVAEEHRLMDKGGHGDGLSPEEHERLRRVQVSLDQCWDLIRQRRAREEFGLDPDATSPRPEATVEQYEQ